MVTEEHVKALAGYDPSNVGETEIAFTPGRVVLQDFTGVPCVVDLASMRDAMREGANAALLGACASDCVEVV